MALFRFPTNVIHAIEVFGTLEEPSFVLTILSMENNSLELDSYEFYDHWENLVSDLPKNALTLWVINDEGVLTKMRMAKDQPLSFEQAFPQIERSNFYWKATESLWCLVRKTHWDAWIDKITSIPVILLNTYMGSNPLNALHQEWNETISSNRYHLHYADGELLKLSPMKEIATANVTLMNNQLPSASLLGFAAVLAYCKHYPVTIFKVLAHLLIRTFRTLPQEENPFEQIQLSTVYEGLNQRFRRSFLSLSLTLLIGLFFFALGLQLWENKETKEQLNLQNEYRTLKQQVLRLDSLWQTTDQKWRTLEQKATIQIIPFVDRILHSLPPEIVLEQLQWIESKDANEAPQHSAKLHLKGKLKQKSILTDWVEQLQQFPKVADVHVAQLVVLKAPYFQFELQITFYAQPD